MIETVDWQRCEYTDALLQHSIGILESQSDLNRIPLGFGRIGNTPMRSHRLTRPERAGLAGRVVTNGEDKIEDGRARLSELAPGLGTEAGDVVAEAPQ